MQKDNQQPVLIVEAPKSGVALLRLNRPGVHNALNLALRQALAKAFDSLTGDDRVRCIVLTGNDKAFCAGADLAEYVDATPKEVMERNLLGLWGPIAHCPKPVIAAVNGYAIGGGCELAMHADIIIAGSSAQFSQPEIKVGIIPGGGATQRLTGAAGKATTMKLLLTGQSFTASQAKDMHLISDIVADDQVLPEALGLAQTIAAQPALAAQHIKALVLESMNAPLDVGIRSEMKAFQLMFGTPEKTERMRKFLTKS